MKIEVYGFSPDIMACPNCRRVINLLEKKNLKYTFHSVITGIERGRFIRDEAVTLDIMNRMGWEKGHPINVPQVFIDDLKIGGYYALDRFLAGMP